MANRKIRRTNLILVAVIAGGIGTYALIHSLAATSKIFYVDVNSTNGPCSDSRTADQVAQNTPLCSLGKALALATGGETINVANGTYDAITLTRQLPQPVTIRGIGSTKPIIQGPPLTDHSYPDRAVSIFGGSNLTIENMSIQGGTVYIASHPTLKFQQVSHDITFRNNEFSGGGAIGMTIRDGSRNITVENNHFHDLWSGIWGPNYRIVDSQDKGYPLVDGVVIRNNLMERFTADGMMFGDWDNVVIDRNVIQGVHDPGGTIHNDVIQFIGYSHHVQITNNTLNDSTHQIILIQPALGPIDDVLVENNVISGSGAYAVQSQGVTKARFINNTMWDSVYSTLLLRGADGFGRPAATDTVVANNILSSIAYLEGAKTAYEDYNLIYAINPQLTYGPHDLKAVDPKFIDAGAGDFHLAAGSPAIGAGTAQYAPLADKDGQARVGAPDLGAYEYGSTTTPPPSTGKRGDVTGPNGTPDGQIDIRDMSYLIRNYGLNDAKADISGANGAPDGKVDIYDLSYIIRNYGK